MGSPFGVWSTTFGRCRSVRNPTQLACLMTVWSDASAIRKGDGQPVDEQSHSTKVAAGSGYLAHPGPGWPGSECLQARLCRRASSNPGWEN